MITKEEIYSISQAAAHRFLEYNLSAEASRVFQDQTDYTFRLWGEVFYCPETNKAYTLEEIENLMLELKKEERENRYDNLP